MQEFIEKQIITAKSSMLNRVMQNLLHEDVRQCAAEIA
jgi:hypothetical protein